MCYSQIDNSHLETPLILKEDSVSRKLGFNANLFCYLKNNEYFNKLMDGFSLFGYWANPKLTYQPHKKVSIEAGVFASRYFGFSGFDTLMPTMTLRIKEKNWNFLFGNLEGGYSHRQIEPIYNFEKGLKNPMEQGFQAKYVKKNTFLDAWIDWQLFTQPGKTNQDHISGKLVYFHKPIKVDNHSIVFPIQYGVYHKGGQNIVSKLPVITSHNLALGNQVNLYLDSSKKIVIENYFILYAQDSVNGKGFMSIVRFQSKRFQAIASFWKGYKFDSPQGGDLYQSTSRMLNSNYYETNRNILILRAIYSKEIIDNLHVSIRFEPFYDFTSKKIEHSEGLYFVYKLPRVGVF